MILFAIVSLAHCITCPHTRGDDPAQENIRFCHLQLVPTRVGMILHSDTPIMREDTCPHTRGDDPAP